MPASDRLAGHERYPPSLTDERRLDLGRLDTLPTATAELALDVGVLTFCDSTLADFIDVMLRHMPVTVVHTNQWVREYLSLLDVADRVQIVEGAS